MLEEDTMIPLPLQRDILKNNEMYIQEPKYKELSYNESIHSLHFSRSQGHYCLKYNIKPICIETVFYNNLKQVTLI